MQVQLSLKVRPHRETALTFWLGARAPDLLKNELYIFFNTRLFAGRPYFGGRRTSPPHNRNVPELLPTSWLLQTTDFLGLASSRLTRFES
jgi:hypothetical protein